MVNKQISFFEISKNKTSREAFKSVKIFGGSLNKGKRKSARPISLKKWMHITLKSTSAKGVHSMLNIKFRIQIDRIIKDAAKKYYIRLKDGVNMGNHFHLQIKCKTRQDFHNFLRIVTGKIAMLVTGAKKGNSFGRRFWDELAYSRIVSTQFEEKHLHFYLQANKIEREKGYQARLHFLKDINMWIKKIKKVKSFGEKV